MAACWSTEDRTACDDDNSDWIASSTVKTEKGRRMLIWSHLETPSPETRILNEVSLYDRLLYCPIKANDLLALTLNGAYSFPFQYGFQAIMGNG